MATGATRTSLTVTGQCASTAAMVEAGASKEKFGPIMEMVVRARSVRIPGWAQTMKGCQEVPVDESTIFAADDLVLKAAEQALLGGS